jgi:hypothetical protein
MAKSIKSIYFASQVLLEAERQRLDLSAICNEALLIAINREKNQGNMAGAFGNYLESQAQRTKDVQIVRKVGLKQSPNYNSILRLFAEKYGITLQEALKEAGL